MVAQMDVPSLARVRSRVMTELDLRADQEGGQVRGENVMQWEDAGCGCQHFSHCT